MMAEVCHMNRKRIITIGIVILLGFTGLVIRLAQIQLFDVESFSDRHINLIQKSIEQRTTGFVVNNGRGLIVDRNGVKLNSEEKDALILFPFLKESDWPIKKVAEILNVPPGTLKYAIQQAKKPFAFESGRLPMTDQQKEAINALKIPGVQVLRVRYYPRDKSSYIVGAIGENSTIVSSRYPELLKNGTVTSSTPVGVMGLEEAFDPFLISHHEQKLLYHTTATGEPLFDESVKFAGETDTDYYPLKVVSTLDESIQEMAEQALDNAGIKRGGVVILDANTSDLLAMVSRPALDPMHPFKNRNLMLTPQYPGSVFKVVTAAASIQNNIVSPTEMFNCNQNPYGDGEGDRKLGELDFKNSFYQSCNFTFATLANRMMETDPKVIDKFASRLGLMQKVGWAGNVFHMKDFKEIADEGDNVIWGDESDRSDHKAIAQTAIGQRNVKMTPLSIANMMATIARGGEKRSVRTATEIDYHKLQGVSLTTFPQQDLPGDTIDRYTAMKLEELLRGVVKDPNGTAHRLADASYPVAGKSGTAETGHGYTNQWFAGYFPADDPKYVMVVVDLESHQGSIKTYDTYETLVNQLYKVDHEK
jgi:penicillin-binding protein 4B